MAYRVGVDVGGTFTDFAFVDEETGTARLFKVASTPDNPARAILTGLTELMERGGLSAQEIVYFSHGTTVATNAVIERKGARTALLTTDGFRDVLEIRRGQRPDPWNIDVPKPVPLVPRELRFEVCERLYPDGTVGRALDEESVRRVLAKLPRDIEAIAVSFLHSYLDGSHESRAGAIIAKTLQDVTVCLSHELVREFREYERTSTCVFNAYLMPVMRSYLRSLRLELQRIGVRVAPRLLQSNGGIMSLSSAEDRPFATLFSGPSAGVTGACVEARSAGFSDLITFDMGGTSTDVCLITGGVPTVSNQAVLEGYALRCPAVDIHSVGAGGGSIAWVDDGGLLHVGPQSAGAHPGPCCYRRGGANPTVTDANLVLGRLSGRGLLGGEMPLDVHAAASALTTHVADRLGVDPLTAAQSVVAVVNANIIRAIKLVSVERGFDPRDFALVAFGGAGPMHAGRLADELGIKTVLVPANPGVLCALGLLVADHRGDFSMTRVRALADMDRARLAELLEDLDREAADWIVAQGSNGDAAVRGYAVDMRYRGQNFELTVPLSAGSRDAPELERLEERFHTLHEQTYGYRLVDVPTELVTLRLHVEVPVPRLRPRTVAPASGRPRPRERRAVFFEEHGDFIDCPVFDRTTLGAGCAIRGPAVVEQLDATTLVYPDQEARTDQGGNLIIDCRVAA